MCGRGGLDYDWKTLWQWMNLPGDPPDGRLRRLNVAPSRRRRGEVQWTRIPVVRPDDGRRRVDALIWPLLPHWIGGELPKFSTANCRSETDRRFSETVAGKPAFRHAWKKDRRCLVPMSWFYEWDKRPSPSQPWRVLPQDDPLLVMAGLWDRTARDDGKTVDSFTIITTAPNTQLEEIGHDRAPVLLSPDEFDDWLAGPPERAEQLLVPPPEDRIRVEPVTRRVNNPEYQDEDLLDPRAAGDEQ